MREQERYLVGHAIRQHIQRLQIILEGKGLHASGRARPSIARGTAMHTQKGEDILLELARLELVELEYNLERLDRAEAGTCEECAAVIPLRRQVDNPTSRKCANCALETA